MDARVIVFLLLMFATGWWVYTATRKHPVLALCGTVLDVIPGTGNESFLVFVQLKNRGAILRFRAEPTAHCAHENEEECFHGKREDLELIIKAGRMITVTTHDPEEWRTIQVHRLITPSLTTNPAK